MALEIKIRWDGDVQGIGEHRLSLASFGDALTELLHALRRIATQMVSNAMEGEQPKTGRFADLARRVDIEIVSIQGESTGFDGVVSFAVPPDELPLIFPDLANRAVTELLDSIERESEGHLANAAVRRYLRKLPPGVHRQSYEVRDNGQVRKRIDIGDIRFSEIPDGLQSLREVEGHVVGVGFPPGKPEVRIKTEVGVSYWDATPDDVERTLNVRKQSVRVLGVYDGKKTRLLKIAPASTSRFQLSDEAVEEHIFTRWGGVFARLAK